jgi:hypothetical protein
MNEKLKDAHISNHNAAVPSPGLVDREIQVLELRRAGWTWTRIAEQVGYADHTGAYAAYKRAIKRVMEQPVEELRTQELDRLDRLQVAAWQAAVKGDTKAILTILRIMERRAKLIGLDKPIKIEQEVTTWDGNESIDRAVRELAQLLTSNYGDSGSEGPMAIEAGEGEPTTAGDELAQLVDSLGSRVGQDEDGSGMDSLGGVTPTQD